MSLFMLAGYETTSTALTYICFILAKHPLEQQKLIDEIDFYCKEEETVCFFFQEKTQLFKIN